MSQIGVGQRSGNPKWNLVNGKQTKSIVPWWLNFDPYLNWDHTMGGFAFFGFSFTLFPTMVLV